MVLFAGRQTQRWTALAVVVACLGASQTRRNLPLGPPAASLAPAGRASGTRQALACSFSSLGEMEHTWLGTLSTLGSVVLRALWGICQVGKTSSTQAVQGPGVADVIHLQPHARPPPAAYVQGPDLIHF